MLAKPIAVQIREQRAMPMPLAEPLRSMDTERLLKRITLDCHSVSVSLSFQENWEGGGSSREVAERAFLPHVDDPAMMEIRGCLSRTVNRIYYRTCRPPFASIGKKPDCEPMVKGLISSAELRSMLGEVVAFYSRINGLDNVMGLEFSDPLRDKSLSPSFSRLLGWYASDTSIHLNMRALRTEIDRESADALLNVTLHEWLHYYFDMLEGAHMWDFSPAVKGYPDHTAEFVRLERLMGIRWSGPEN